jgi:hypothetical protein
VPVPAFTTCIQCPCGAKYERAEALLPIKDVGVYECNICSAVIERWQGRVVPMFKLIERPKQSSAA